MLAWFYFLIWCRVTHEFPSKLCIVIVVYINTLPIYHIIYIPYINIITHVTALCIHTPVLLECHVSQMLPDHPTYNSPPPMLPSGFSHRTHCWHIHHLSSCLPGPGTVLCLQTPGPSAPARCLLPDGAVPRGALSLRADAKTSAGDTTLQLWVYRRSH